MNHSDIRKHLKKGELAVEAIEKLGFVFVDNQREHPHWVAPESPMDDLKDALEAIIKTRVQEAVKNDPRGPNWHLVEGMVGKDFQVRPENIPLGHALRGFGFDGHFRGKNFNAIEIKYRRDPNYTGYAVSFNFATRPFRPETVWIPLSACAFRP